MAEDRGFDLDAEETALQSQLEALQAEERQLTERMSVAQAEFDRVMTASRRRRTAIQGRIARVRVQLARDFGYEFPEATEPTVRVEQERVRVTREEEPARPAPTTVTEEVREERREERRPVEPVQPEAEERPAQPSRGTAADSLGRALDDLWTGFRGRPKPQRPQR